MVPRPTLTVVTWQLLTLISGICGTCEHCRARPRTRARKVEGHVIVEGRLEGFSENWV
jgi:hypothetical protein